MNPSTCSLLVLINRICCTAKKSILSSYGILQYFEKKKSTLHKHNIFKYQNIWLLYFPLDSTSRSFVHITSEITTLCTYFETQTCAVLLVYSSFSWSTILAMEIYGPWRFNFWASLNSRCVASGTHWPQTTRRTSLCSATAITASPTTDRSSDAAALLLLYSLLFNQKQFRCCFVLQLLGDSGSSLLSYMEIMVPN